MSEPENSRSKLVPLRKFAVKGIYSAAYLSQLVQRDKLRAKRIGRNFYTCEIWFQEYLDRHARDAKAIKYREYQKERQAGRETAMRAPVLPWEDTGSKQANFFVIKDSRDLAPAKSPRKINTMMIASILVFFVLALNLYYVFSSNRQGRVAGEQDSAYSAGTTTEEGF